MSFRAALLSRLGWTSRSRISPSLSTARHLRREARMRTWVTRRAHTACLAVLNGFIALLRYWVLLPALAIAVLACSASYAEQLQFAEQNAPLKLRRQIGQMLIVGFQGERIAQPWPSLILRQLEHGDIG